MHHSRTTRALVMLAAAAPALRAGQFPVAGEALHYSINWASGLSLGDVYLRSAREDGKWRFEATIEAAVPGFTVADHYRSLALDGLCSLALDKGSMHGGKRTRERTTFDYRRGLARRATAKGGKSEFRVGSCARDALAFVFYARQELAEGRVPSEATVFFGAQYRVKLDYEGAETVRVNGAPAEADRMLVSVKGPAAGIDFEIYYARDAVRTPVLVKVPLELGLVSMELVP